MNCAIESNSTAEVMRGGGGGRVLGLLYFQYFTESLKVSSCSCVSICIFVFVVYPKHSLILNFGLGLCPECTYRLNYHHKKREVTRNKTKKQHNHEESGPSKRKKNAEETPEKSYEDQKQQSDEDEKTCNDDSDGGDEGKIWREGNFASEEKSRDEEFQEYLEELLL